MQAYYAYYVICHFSNCPRAESRPDSRARAAQMIDVYRTVDVNMLLKTVAADLLLDTSILGGRTRRMRGPRQHRAVVALA